MRKMIITHLSAPRQGEAQEFGGELIRIGRGEWNELVFGDSAHAMVSRNHAEIRQREDSYILTDSQSSTGTFVNGEKISHAVLKNNDSIRFGKGGPEIQVSIPSADLKATVVVPSLQDSSSSNRPLPPPGPAATLIQEVARVEVPSGPPSTPLPQPRPSPSPTVSPSAPDRSTVWQPPQAATPAASVDLVALHKRLNQVMLGGAVVIGILLLLALLSFSRISSAHARIEEHTARMDKLDAAIGDLIQRISTLDPKNLHQTVQQRMREMDQKAERMSREMERRARETEQRLSVIIQQKSREMDEQFEILGQAYPQVRLKMEEIRRRRGR